MDRHTASHHSLAHAARIGAVLSVALLALSGCTGDGPPVESPYVQNVGSDPKQAWVRLWGNDNLFKRCDGTTLIYREGEYLKTLIGGVTALPNSPECR